MKKFRFILITLLFIMFGSCSEPPPPKARAAGPHYKAFMVTTKHPVSSRTIRAKMAPLGKVNIRQLDAKTYLVTFYQPQALAQVRLQSTKRLRLYVHPDYGKSNMPNKQVKRGGEQVANEFLITTNGSMSEGEIKSIFRLQGKIVIRKVMTNTYLIQFQQRVDLKNLERAIQGSNIQQVQPNFKYRATGI